MKIAVYPGSFDPVTKGHLDIIERASKLFDHVIVTVMFNQSKAPMFSPDERIALLEKTTSHLSNVSVDKHMGLLIDYLKLKEARILVKGLRAISDFEAEFQMASVNQKLCKEIETVFIMTRTDYMYLSSSIVKEVASFGGDISDFVTEEVKNAIFKKIGG
ncbi:pantetheine-phosphate adenylyltransferase [Fusibacter sp. 3D3]|uniref:pantetheine-phosphate adenylyltransferase n=1 Tax=Fusibacter sp. 3D3 TaxID=1048380 RepID=UPI0008531767|nr:pantetheine-phosphate adenylyltransferase [Fusibacter sp. 3D3]GAU78756.1 phosphopantetheine adenylyltransferase [Fusibacter sp. 3D3]